LEATRGGISNNNKTTESGGGWYPDFEEKELSNTKPRQTKSMAHTWLNNM
jgi:hypothetical protein